MSEQSSRPFGSYPVGKQIPQRFADGVVGYWDSWRVPTPHSLERARHYFPEARAEDFEPLGTTGRRWRDRASGEEYRVERANVLELDDPRKSGVSCFCIHQGQLVFLRRRGYRPSDEAYMGVIHARQVG